MYIIIPLLFQLAAQSQGAFADFNNPVFWEDLADLDVFRVDDTYYYSASTMAFSPGAPILQSYDLINWEFIGHSVPVLDFSSDYYLNGGNAYVKGIWASFLRYLPESSTWIWGGCIEFANTYIFTAAAPEGPWTQSAVIDTCYYDAGLLVDDDGSLYVAYGSTDINVAALTSNGTSQINTTTVYTSDVGYIEGSRFYKINDIYYILVTQPASAEYVLKSTTGPFGPYEAQVLVSSVGSPVTDSGYPHQGGLIDTADGNWYYMAFVDAYPGGRIPVLAPVSFDANGWPVVQLVDGAWGKSYDSPVANPAGSVASPTGTDNFDGSTLSANWEWNHNPDNSKWSLDNGLVLQTASITDDLYAANNTLTTRILGPASSATILLDFSLMVSGDRAGLVLFRDQSAWIGIQNNDGVSTLALVDNINMENGTWTTTNTGEVVNTKEISVSQIYLRVDADIRPSSTFMAMFSYSTDGENYSTLGPNFTMSTNWEFFIGYRYGIFNYATSETGGSVTVKSFSMLSA